MSKMHPVLKRLFDEDIVYQKISRTMVDATWGTQKDEAKEYHIKAKIFIITEEDLIFERGATWKVGDARGFFHGSYTVGQDVFEPEIGDKVIFRNLTFEIQRKTPWADRKFEYWELYLKRV